eukprot:sb/3478557/
MQEPTEISKQPIRTPYLGHVTGYQPIRDLISRFLGKGKETSKLIFNAIPIGFQLGNGLGTFDSYFVPFYQLISSPINKNILSFSVYKEPTQGLRTRVEGH